MASSRTFNTALDPETLESLRELQSPDDPDFLKNYLRLFMTPVQRRLDAIEDAIRNRNLELLQTEAHALKSSSANVGAIQMRILCADLEQVARGMSPLKNAPDLIRSLKQEWLRVKAEIESLPEYR